MTTNEYAGSTASELDHYFGHTIGFVRIDHSVGKDLTLQDIDRIKNRFVKGLETTIEKELPEYDAVTYKHLREMIGLVENADLSDIETVKMLYRRYSEIRDMQFDEKRLFGSSNNKL